MSGPPMNTDPVISIIIPVYNVESYIGECLRSVLTQQGNIPVEIILVDDGSTDGSMDIAEKMLNQTPAHQKTCILRHERCRGCSAARNTGTAVATGEYIFYLDSDDLLASDAMLTLLQAARQSGADITVGSCKLTISTSDPFFKTTPGEWNNEACTRAFFSRLIQPMAWNKLIKRDWLVQSGVDFHEGIIHEDELWMASLALRRAHVFVIGHPTYMYRNVRTGSVMNQARLRSMMSYLTIVRILLFRVWRENPEIRKLVWIWCFSIFKGCLIRCVLGPILKRNYSMPFLHFADH